MKVVRKRKILKTGKKPNIAAAPKMKHTFQLVKWEGEAPQDWKEIEHPEGHPQCAEVIQWNLGQPKQVIYKKE